jgi:hypothetical protein
MNALPLSLIACALSLSLAACADMEWTRAGADKAAVSRDLDECRGAALRRAPPSGGVVSQDPQMVDRGATPSSARPAGTSNERFMAEHEDVRRCMSGKGYQLARGAREARQ